MAQTKMVAKVYPLSATETLVEYKDGSWELHIKNDRNQVISRRSVNARYAERRLAGLSGEEQNAVISPSGSQATPPTTAPPTTRPPTAGPPAPSSTITPPTAGPPAPSTTRPPVVIPTTPPTTTSPPQPTLPPNIDFGALASGTTSSSAAPSRQPTLPPGIDFSALATATKKQTSTPVATTSPAPKTTNDAPNQTPTSAPAGVTVIDPSTGQQVVLPPGIDFGWLASQIPVDWEKAAREMFPYWYDAFKNDPEMRAFIEKIMTGPDLSDDRLLAELQKTNWWRTTNGTARSWLQLETTDPATANTQIQNTVAALRNEALSRGLSVSDTALNDAALNINKFGFSTQVALEHLAQVTLGEAGGPSQLVRGYYGQEIKKTAASYGVPLSDVTLNKWVADIATGRQNQDSFESYVRDLSKNLYPALSSGFDRGLTFDQMTNPYAQVASNILEIPDAQVDFTDPKWAAAFTMRDSKGQQVQMSFGEWADYLRTNPAFGYEYTDGARDKAYQVVNDLAKAFGAA